MPAWKSSGRDIRKHLSAGIVLTGGGSLIKGTAELAHEVLGLPVKIGIPGGFSSAGLCAKLKIQCSDVRDLVIDDFRNKDAAPVKFTNGNGKQKKVQVGTMLKKMKSWFEERDERTETNVFQKIRDAVCPA